MSTGLWKRLMAAAGGCFLLAVAGCTMTSEMMRSEVRRDRAVSIAEALLLPQGAPLYTAFNLWEQEPGEMNARNYQLGALVPVGTPVVPVSAQVDELVFEHATTGARYVLSFDPGEMMMPIEDYIRLVFTLRPPEELLADATPEQCDAIRKGVVTPGMNRDQVFLTFGPPTPARTPNQKNSTWIYDRTRDSSLRVIFRGNKVRDVIDFLED